MPSRLGCRLVSGSPVRMYRRAIGGATTRSPGSASARVTSLHSLARRLPHCPPMRVRRGRLVGSQLRPQSGVRAALMGVASGRGGGHRVILRVISHSRLEKEHPMTAAPVSTLPGLLDEQLARPARTCCGSCSTTFINALLSAEADTVCGAEYGARSPDRANRRNGYRHRDLDTRVGTLDVAIPKLRSGTLLPGLAAGAPPAGRGGADQRWSRPATCSGCRPGGWTSWSSPWASPGCRKSQVREMAKDLDAQVEAFRTRPLDAGPYTFVAADALMMKVREGGRVVKRHASWSPPGSTPTATGRSSACRSPPPSTAPAGWRSSATWSPAA